MTEQEAGGGSGSSAGGRRSAGSMTMDPLIGRVLFDRYEILQRIGAGGMGAVYLARQRTIDRKVALKVLRTDLMSNEHVRLRFKREAEVMAKLRHPNTIQLFDYGETEDGLSVMVMELLVGQSLQDRLKTKGPFTILEAVTLGEEVASSLCEAHGYGLVHRDLKPANIFIEEVGKLVQAKVLDFGIARLVDEEATRLTSTGQVFGTPRYMSPEQAMSTGDVDARSDLYSLALIIYECIVGQPPFVAQTSIQYLSAHTTQAPPKLREKHPDAPAVLEALIDACLAKEPQNRPLSAEEVARALVAIRRSLEEGKPIAPLAILLPKPEAKADPTLAEAAKTDAPGAPGKSRFVAGVALLLAAGLLVGGTIWLTDGREATGGGGGSAPLAMGPGDAGLHTDAGAAPWDAGLPDGGDIAPPEAGVEDEPPDGGHEESTDAGEEAPDGRPKPKPRRRPPIEPTPPGDGVVTGPRGLVLDVEDDDGEDLLSVAKRCETSVYAGLATLATKGCPKGCKIIVDSQCAGTTPAEDRAIPPGSRNVTLICDGRVKGSAQMRFEESETQTFSCR